MPVKQIPGYNGNGDAFLNWDETAQDFSQQENFNRDVTIVISNSGAADKSAILFPSRVPSDPTAVIVDDDTFATTLTASIDINTIAELIAQTFDEPMYLVGMKISSNNEAVGDSSLIYTKKDVFKPTPTSKKFSFIKSQSQFANNNKIFDVKIPKLLIGPKRELSLTIPKRISADEPTKVTVILQFGVALSTESALENKAIMAGAN